MNAIPTLPRPSATRPASRGSRTVLVVDDYAPICDLVAWHLSAHGYGVFATQDPVEAQDMIRSDAGCRIDLLLTGVEMPKMNGLELAAWCAGLRPHIRVVFMTSNWKCRPNRAADGFLQKPFSLARLSTAVRDALDIPASSQPGYRQPTNAPLSLEENQQANSEASSFADRPGWASVEHITSQPEKELI